MRRMSLFEWSDQPWLPRVLRTGITGYLEALGRRFPFFSPVGPKLEQLLCETSTGHIVDLASGGGGPIVSLSERMRAKDGAPVTVSLTDFLVDTAAFARIEQASSGRVRGVLEPVDARHVPARLAGARTLFNALHHFSPDDARAILRDAAEQRVPIVVVEASRRRLGAFLIALLASPLQVLLVMPFVRPLSLGHVVFTYLVPVLPLLIAWDAAVSCLRAYTLDELSEMTKAADGERYTWEIGELPIPKTGAFLTYVIGKPA